MKATDAVPQIIDNVELLVHEVATLRERFPDWDELSHRERHRLVQETEPLERHTTHNVTCIGLHEYIVSNLHPDETDNESVTHLALGDDDSTAPAVENTSLNNEVYRTAVTDPINNGDDLLASTFLDSNMANGENLREAGLVNTSDEVDYILFNHSLIDDPEGRLQPKTSEITAILNVTLRMRDGT